jgi:anti-sigma regulatory factor (Ser/Thr protein kinase)
MSIESLVKELTAAQSFDVVDVRAKIQKEFDAATTSEQRGAVLAIFKATMDQVERSLTERGG